MSERLAEHVARLFTRDPVPAYEGEFIEEQIDDEEIASHFENLQSTNWNSMRFKPPPSKHSNIGWRVEFRTMDIQLTDFENTCLVVFLGLIVNVCNTMNVNFLLPITMADENLKRAHKRDAILKEKFWFNVNCFDPAHPLSELDKHDFMKSSENVLEPVYEELTMQEILCGKGQFIGLVNMMRAFMSSRNYADEHLHQFEHIFEFLMARARGEVPTAASFIRNYITSHPLYRKNSVVSPCLIKELVCQILKLNNDQLEGCSSERKTETNSEKELDAFVDEFKKGCMLEMFDQTSIDSE